MTYSEFNFMMILFTLPRCPIFLWRTLTFAAILVLEFKPKLIQHYPFPFAFILRFIVHITRKVFSNPFDESMFWIISNSCSPVYSEYLLSYVYLKLVWKVLYVNWHAISNQFSVDRNHLLVVEVAASAMVYVFLPLLLLLFFLLLVLVLLPPPPLPILLLLLLLLLSLRRRLLFFLLRGLLLLLLVVIIIIIYLFQSFYF